MTAGVRDVLEQLRVAIGKLDEAAMFAKRAQIDAEEAAAQFAAAGHGTDHPQMTNATTEAREAADKAGKVARLYAEAAAEYARYANHLAPGTMPERRSTPAAMPAGEQLVENAEARAARAEVAWRKQVNSAGDIGDALREAEKGSKAVFKYVRHRLDPPSGGTSTTAGHPPAPPQQHHAQVEHPVTAIVMAAGSLAVAAKAVWKHLRQRQERKQDHDDQ